jgi:hypothetical protein
MKMDHVKKIAKKYLHKETLSQIEPNIVVSQLWDGFNESEGFFLEIPGGESNFKE